MNRLTIALVLTAGVLSAQPNRPVQEFQTRAGVLKLTPIQHATALLEAGGQAVYIDPWSQGNFAGLPKADVILITDIHGDHMDPKAIEAIRKAGTKILAPAAVAETVKDAEVIANGGSKTSGAWKFEAVPMYNLNRGPAPGKLFHDKGRGNGYVITYGGTRIYFSGDTEPTPEMKALKNIDVALICMNLPYTMTPEEAAEAVRGFKPKIAIPYHYRDSDTQKFAKALEGSGTEVRLIDWYYK